ncbi:MAG TPA: glycosyltransferase family 4 protein [Acidimicrobiales bacterium]|nr:glycosyltransferase family 4 protein [Acidimicrobiales bacterium]
MRVLYVVQRYGLEVAGGAELHCRQFATHMAQRGHRVEVVTTCAQSYVDWANAYPPGSAEVDGVVVHRLPTSRPRDPDSFGPLNDRVPWGPRPIALHVQRAWMHAQGPVVPELVPWLSERAGAAAHDAVVFFTYLYWTTWAGLPAVAGKVPTALHPTAHDEPSLSLSLFDATFRLPDGLAFSTEEERDLVRRRFRVDPPSAVLGIGFDPDLSGDAGAFRRSHGLGDSPYLVVVGRVDAAKGSDELFDFFAAYKQRHPGPLKLVVVGEPVQAPPAHPDVVVTGFVDEATKRGAVEGATLLVQPSYFESFSMVLAEGWLQRRPALVQGHCETLAGHARRSRGAIAYRGYAEFEAALELVTADEGLARALGDAGRRYICSNYRWEAVLDRYEELLGRITAPARVRRSVPAPARGPARPEGW